MLLSKNAQLLRLTARLIEIFTDQLHMTVNRCYLSVATVKKEQLKMVHLKRNSAPKAPNRLDRYFQALFSYLTSDDAVDLKHPEKVSISLNKVDLTFYCSLFKVYYQSSVNIAYAVLYCGLCCKVGQT